MRIVVLFDVYIFYALTLCARCMCVLFHRAMMDRRDGRRGDNTLNFWPNHSPLFACLALLNFKVDEMRSYVPIDTIDFRYFLDAAYRDTTMLPKQ